MKFFSFKTQKQNIGPMYLHNYNGSLFNEGKNFRGYFVND